MSIMDEDNFHAFDNSPLNAFRRPDWRWLRHVAGDQPYRDSYNRGLMKWSWCRGPFPSQRKALAIYFGPPLRCAELEARVLARQSVREISDCMDERPETLDWYEALFFDVRSKLDCESWITHAVLKPNRTGVLDKQDLPLLWKHWGYWGGLDRLEELLGAADPEEIAQLGVDAYLSPSSRLPMNEKFRIATWRLPPPRTRADSLRKQRVEEQIVAPRPAVEKEIFGPLVMRVTLPEDSDPQGDCNVVDGEPIRSAA